MKRQYVRGARGAYQPAPKEARRTQKTGWNEMAPWYAGWAGGSGHDFHKRFALPALTPLLNVKRGTRVLELGCGFGVLREHVEKNGGVYVGVDKSPAMIKKAKDDARTARSGAHYYISDVALPSGLTVPETQPFDKAVFLFSIQDIDDHRAAIKNASKLLSHGGELVLFMIHPAFRIPRQSGWGKDAMRKLTYRRMDRYKTEITIPLPQRTGNGEGDQVTSFFYHRPLASYMQALKAAGLLVTAFDEIYSGHNDGESEFPHFLLLAAKKS